MKLRTAAVSLVLLCSAGSATAQQGGTAQNPDRAVLERRVRERAAQVTRQRLGLNDAQMQQLQRVNSRFAPQLTSVATQERETRKQLREQMAGTQPDQARVSALIDASLQLQKQRIALIEAEQKELAAFLTPVQRARYLALQTQFRNRANQLARQNSGTRPRGGRRGPPRGDSAGR